MHITLYGSWNNYGDYAEQYFMVVYRHRGHWIILEQGWNRIGKPSEVSKFWYVPFHVGGFIQNIQGGKAFIYTKWEKFIADCTIHPSAVVDGIPMLWWAKSCAIN